jgi:hypothetical protein
MNAQLNGLFCWHVASANLLDRSDLVFEEFNSGEYRLNTNIIELYVKLTFHFIMQTFQMKRESSASVVKFTKYLRTFYPKHYSKWYLFN